MPFLRWLFFDLWDNRTPYEKLEDEKMIESFLRLRKRGYTIEVGPRGGCKLIKLENFNGS